MTTRLRRTDALKTLLILLAVVYLTLALMPHSAHAGQSGSNMHRSGLSHAQHFRGVIKLHRDSNFRGLRKTQRFGRHFDGKREHARFKRHRHHKGRNYLRFERRHRLRHPRYEAPRRADDAPTSYDAPSQSSEYRTPTFKWIHVGALDSDFRSLGERAPSKEGEVLTNCLSVRTQITVDGAPMDAFGKVCIQADGTWRLIPTEQAQY